MLHFRMLGPLEVVDDDGVVVELRGQRQRLLLALLLVRATEIVSTDSLFDALWGEQPPPSAPAALQNVISQLRKVLSTKVLETRAPGYRLNVSSRQIDACEFERLVQEARAQPAAQRAQTLATALALWRGEPLADLTFEPALQDWIRRLSDLRLEARTERIAAELECGRHADVVGEAESLVAAHPAREDLVRLLMIALYRCGRQAEAMRTFIATRTLLDREYGQPPGAELNAAYRAILLHSTSLATPAANGRSRDEPFDAMVAAALASRLVPVLGPGLGGLAAAPDPAAAAHHLAQRFGCPLEYAGTLSRVAQWVAVTHGVGPLYDELRALYDADFSPGPAHRVLAALPPLLRARGLPCQLLLASGFDRMLEQALADAGEAYDVVSFVAFGPDRGKFLFRGADGTARLIEEPNLEIGLAAGERTLILKLNGGTDELTGRVRDSYVVSEDDYIDYLSRSDVAALLPVGLASRLRRTHLLFVGYELDEWSPRVFLRRLWGEEPIAYRSWAVDAAPNRLTAGQWGKLGVEVLELSAEESLEELHRRLAAEPRAEPAA